MDFTCALVTYDKEIGLKKKGLEENDSTMTLKNSAKSFSNIILQRWGLATLRLEG